MSGWSRGPVSVMCSGVCEGQLFSCVGFGERAVSVMCRVGWE